MRKWIILMSIGFGGSPAMADGELFRCKPVSSLYVGDDGQFVTEPSRQTDDILVDTATGIVRFLKVDGTQYQKKFLTISKGDRFSYYFFATEELSYVLFSEQDRIKLIERAIYHGMTSSFRLSGNKELTNITFIYDAMLDGMISGKCELFKFQ